MSDRRYVIQPGPMICASADAESLVYTVHLGKSGLRWLIPSGVRNMAENIYVEGVPGSKGFGGRTIEFPMVDGTTLALKGPWKANSGDLLKDTGIDVRGTTYEFYVIGLKRGRIQESRDTPFGPREFTLDTIEGVLYQDDAPMIARDRKVHPKTLAENMADLMGHSVMMYWDTRGGSCSQPVDPIDPASGRRNRYVAPPEVSHG